MYYLYATWAKSGGIGELVGGVKKERKEKNIDKEDCALLVPVAK